MRIKIKRYLGIMLSLALLLGLMPGFSINVYARGSEVTNDYMGYGIGHDGFDIFGKNGTNTISTTFNDGGYTTVMQVGGQQITFNSFAFNKEYVVDGVKATVNAELIGQAVLITYSLSNTQNTAKTVKIGSHADVQIGTNDKAPVKFYESGILMENGDQKFVIIPNSNPFTTRWIGEYPHQGGNVFSQSTVETLSNNEDSGLAYSWTVPLAAKETAIRSCVFAVGNITFTKLSFDANGGEGDMDDMTVVVVGGHAPTIRLVPNKFTKEGYKVIGWARTPDGPRAFADGAQIIGSATDNITLYAVWKEKSEEKTLNYTGQAQELIIPGTAENGTMMYALGEDDITSPEEAEYSTSIPTGTEPGVYYVWYYAKGDEGVDSTTPVCIIVTILKLADSEMKIPEDGTTTSVDTTTKPIVSDGLTRQANELTEGSEDIVELNLVVTPKGEEKATESIILKNDEQMYDTVIDQYVDEDLVAVDVLEIDIEKIVNGLDISLLPETDYILEIGIKYDFEGKYDPVIIRKHGDEKQVLKALASRPDGNYVDGTFFADVENSMLYIYSNKFSEYVVAYSTVEGNAKIVSRNSSESTVSYPSTTPIYRLFNIKTGAHFYTANKEERDILLEQNVNEIWNDEGIAFQASATSGEPVYRVFDLPKGIHVYTSDAALRDTYISNGCRDEGIAWYSAIKPGRQVYKVSNPANGKILFTTSKEETDMLANVGFTCEVAEFVVY